MIKVREVIESMESWAPQSLAETWDNSGLLTGSPEDSIHAVLIALDVTEDVIRTAQNFHASMIVSHHPPIFKPIRSLSGDSLSSRVIREAILGNIALYSSHTPLDQVLKGVSHALAEKLGLISISFLTEGNSEMVKFVTFAPPDYIDRIRKAAGTAGAGIIGNYSLCSFSSQGTGTYIPSSTAKPYSGTSGELSQGVEDRIEMIVPATNVIHVVETVRKVHPYEEMAYDLIPLKNRDIYHGYGAIGDLPEPMESKQFAAHVSNSLDSASLTLSNDNNKMIKRVAVMGGSGGKYIDSAINLGADAFVTGDLGHHDFVNYSGLITLIDATHYATEFPVLQKISDYLTKEFNGKAKVFIYSSNVLPLKHLWNHSTA
jgi:dinuclear metal center YbgI/SA1388 family protein